jgi:hypothetical protein
LFTCLEGHLFVVHDFNIRMEGSMKMRFKSTANLAVFVLLFVCATVWADQIVLKDGTSYSGEFVRGDSTTIEFRVLSNIERFNIDDVSRISFRGAENKTASAVKSTIPSPSPSKPISTPSIVGSQGLKKAEPQLSERSVRSEPLKTMKQMNSVPETVTLSSGTAIIIRTTTTIDTDRNRAGDSFDATLNEALMFGAQMVAPRGSAVKGRIAYAKESGKLAGQSQLILELTELLVNNKSYLLRTSDYTEVGASRGNRSAATIGGTAVLGTIIGAIAGGGKGAAIGAASGAAVGTGVQVLTKGQTLKVPSETILEFRLQSPLTIGIP